MGKVSFSEKFFHGIDCEAAELTENFQWLTENVKDEKDILIYLIRMSDILGVDMLKNVENKIKRNELKYPVEKCKGFSQKYTELD